MNALDWWQLLAFGFAGGVIGLELLLRRRRRLSVLRHAAAFDREVERHQSSETQDRRV